MHDALEQQPVVIAHAGQGDEVANVVGGPVGPQLNFDDPLGCFQGRSVNDALALGAEELDAVPGLADLRVEFADGLAGQRGGGRLEVGDRLLAGGVGKRLLELRIDGDDWLSGVVATGAAFGLSASATLTRAGGSAAACESARPATEQSR
jgi:hypothetical protein